MNRYLLIFLVCLASTIIPRAGSAQVNGTFKAIRSFGADSATVRTETVGLQLMYDSVGVMYYNRQANPGKWRCYTTFAGWYDCGTGGGGGGSGVNIYNANGSLTAARTLTGAGFDLTFTGLDDFTVSVGTSITFTATNDINLDAGDDLLINGSSGTTGQFIGNTNGHPAWVTPGGFSLTFGDSTQIPITNNAENDFRYTPNLTMTKYGSNYGLFSVGSAAGTDRYLRFAADPTSNGLQILDNGTGNVSIDHNSLIGTNEYAITATAGFLNMVATDGDLLIQNGGVHFMTIAGSTDIVITTGDDLNITATDDIISEANGTYSIEGNVDITIFTTAGTGNDIGISADQDLSLSTSNAGDITILTNGGAGRYLFLPGLPTSCAGAPTGSIAAVAGVLTVCP